MLKIVASGIEGNIGKIFNKNYDFIKYDDDSKVNADIFLHLASKRFGEYGEYINSNILYLSECIEYCKKNKIQNFIFFSAMSIYGNLNQENITENTKFDNPDTYGVSKLFGEKMLEESDLNILIIRTPMVLTQNKEIGILNRIRKELQLHNDIKVTNYNKKFNNFIHADDLLKFILQYNFDKKFEIINFAVEQTKTLYEITLYMKRYLNSNSNIIKDDTKMNFFNIETSKYNSYNIKPMNTNQTLKRWLDEFNKR